MASTDLPPQISPRPQSPNSTLRLSTLYEYHNAPEVAPAHGLEYDDTVYPSSDKYPVIHQGASPPAYVGKTGYDTVARPPRIIFGMKVPTFCIVAALFVCILVGASVGGAVGGRNMRGGDTQNQPASANSSATFSSSSASPQTVVAGSGSGSGSPSSTAASTTSAATPTYTPLSDCAASSNTSYASTYTAEEDSTAGLDFNKYCDVASPLLSSASSSSAANLTATFVYSFDDCVAVCAGYNYYSASSNCSVAVYEASARRPTNCWVGSADLTDASGLAVASGVAVAILASR